MRCRPAPLPLLIPAPSPALPALLALAAALPCPAQPVGSRHFILLDFHRAEGRPWEWEAAEHGILLGPLQVPYPVPQGHTLLVDRIQVTLASAQERRLGWSLPVRDAAGGPLFAFEHWVEAQVPPSDPLGVTAQVDALDIAPAVVLRPGSHIQAPCPSHGVAIRHLRLAGRLIPLDAPPAARP